VWCPCNTHVQPDLGPRGPRRATAGDPSAIPLLGWGNWIVLPIALVGAGIGALSRSDKGRNFCLIVFGLATLRLMLGGGIF